VLREVEISEGRLHGWIDLLAFDPRTRTLLIIEIKTSIDDIGRLERQIGWYARAVATATPPGGQPTRVVAWVLALASTDVEQAIARHRTIVDETFPGRAATMRGLVTGLIVTPHERAWRSSTRAAADGIGSFRCQSMVAGRRRHIRVEPERAGSSASDPCRARRPRLERRSKWTKSALVDARLMTKRAPHAERASAAALGDGWMLVHLDPACRGRQCRCRWTGPGVRTPPRLPSAWSRQGSRRR
jgi:hypothetical protein